MDPVAAQHKRKVLNIGIGVHIRKQQRGEETPPSENGKQEKKSVDNNEENEEDDLAPRPYQSQVLDLALKTNTIVFLPTGSGKTFIAVMLIRRMAADIQKDFSSGGKRTFFLVNTVALAEQQKKYIQRHTALSVGHYTGDMNLDFWKEPKWRAEFDKHQVLVMTAQILHDLLMHCYLELKNVNLIVFDECHHAVNQHCMSKIMKFFEASPVEEQPRVLGLTATLLNSSVKCHKVGETVKTLEDTFFSHIATIENINEVESFSTCPNEKSIVYDEPKTSNVIEQVLSHLSNLQEFVLNHEFDEDKTQAPIVDGAKLQQGKKWSKKVMNRLGDVSHHLSILGVYGGSLSALKLIMHIERLRAKAESSDTMRIYLAIITTLTMVRKLLEDEMAGTPEGIKIVKFSSPQVITLLEVVKEYKPDDGRGIIFVERRLTAKVLFHVLRAASEHCEGLNFVQADFVVGFQNNPLNGTREGQLEKKWNREAIEKFQKGETNIIIASDVLEEGIDVPQCKLVVKFDVPKSYRSYVQSKGRARHRNSYYILLIPRAEGPKVIGAVEEYRRIENMLKGILSGNDIHPDESSDDSMDSEDEEIYNTDSGARVTYQSAIPLVNRYCSKLPQDIYTKLIPYWFMKDGTGTLAQCLLHLPINSPLKQAFVGKLMKNKKLAKQSAAFAACLALHEALELNDNLLPVGRRSDELIDDESIFSVYHEAAEYETMEQPGTKKCRRQYPKELPRGLSGCIPRKNVSLRLHVLLMSPVYEAPPEDNSRKYAFYKLLKSETCFAILSSKVLPELCDFPVFLNVGKIAVSFIVNSALVYLNEEEIQKLQQFNTMLFFDLLKLHKSYLVADLENGENNYFVVPVSKNECGTFEIDWKIIRDNCQLPTFKQPTESERLNAEDGTWSKYEHSIVVPWYRDTPPEQMYIVTKVCEEFSPLSVFPTSAFSTFEDYFHKKYNLLINNSSQPLFEVKAISNRLNCLRPRSLTGHVTGRFKRQEQNDDFEEHLVPELCIPVDFPSALWVKAICVPSCLHRISHLLLAEELRQQIANDLDLLPHSGKWEPVEIDPICIADDAERSKHIINNTFSKKSLKSKEDPWGDEGEPVDIDRERVEDITLMDILYYEEFINKPAIPDDSLLCSDDEINVELKVITIDDSPIPEISLLKEEQNVQLAKILQALTSASSGDALNLERLETLGDSFLKFASSLFLFLKYPKLDEGKLTQAKGKIVGNRNLFYCGKARDIIGKIKVHEFNPKSDWIPPTYCIPKEIKQSLHQLELCPSILLEIMLPREEQESGYLSSKSQSHWKEIVHECDRKYTPCPTESLLGVQNVPDKMVADCVEALIGAYLQGYGIEGALKLVCWFGILPYDLASPSRLFGESSYSPYVTNESDVLARVEYHLEAHEVRDIEKRLDYVFNDKGYLLQALSHASFSQNRVTDCYQRLEFLGDAILDFLITCYIYENCGGLSPGDLTDLRSALVNNITFGSLAVRYEFQKYCKYDSAKLFDKIDSFVKYQEKHRGVNEDMLLLLGEEDCQDTIGESVDVPKVLGDLFESLAGAIYLDSGKSLQTVWRVYYRLMKLEIEEFSKVIPKQPVRKLYELCNPPPVFNKACEMKDEEKVMIEVEVLHKGERKKYYGVGENKAAAKRTAAKVALRDLF